MTDIAELGFAVNTSGLKEGSTELDKFKQSAKGVEDQVKKTDAATSKASDGAKKLGEDSKAAASGMGAAEAAAKRLGISVEEYGKRTQATKDAITAANTATQAVAPAMNAAATATRTASAATQAATTVSQASLAATRAVTAATSATAPAMVAAATATRAVAVEKAALTVTSANLAGALNTVRPAVIGLGGAMGTLPAVAAAAKFGIAGVATAIAGGLVASMVSAADRAENTRARFGALTGSFQTGSAAADRLRTSAERGGASLTAMGEAAQKIYAALRTPENVPGSGLIRIGDNAEQAAQKTTKAIAEINDAMRRAHVPTEEIEKGLKLFAQNIDSTGRLTGEGLRKIAAEVPQFARVLAQGLSGGFRDAREQARLLDFIPATIDQMTQAANRYSAATDKAFDPNRPKPAAESLNEMGRSWDRLVQSIANTGAFEVANKLLEGLASGVDVITNFFKNTNEIIPKSIEWLTLFGTTFVDGLTVLVNAVAGPGATVIGFFTEGIVAGINVAVSAVSSGVQSIIAWLNSLVDAAVAAGRAIANALTQSPAGGPAQGFPAISDTGNLSGGVGEGGDNGAIISDIMRNVTGNAKGNAFANGRVTPFARGGIVTRPTIFPMATGMGLMGEAGPEAVMPLKRGADGELGVSVSGGGAPGLPRDPFTDLEFAIEDQTTEFRTSLSDMGDEIGADFTSGVDQIVAAIEAGNILLKDFTTKTTTAAPVDTFDTAVGGFDSAVQQFGTSVQAATGGGQYPSSQSFGVGGSGMTFGSKAGAPGTSFGSSPAQMRTTLILSSGSGGGSSGSGIAEALGFYDAWGGGRQAGGGDDLRGSQAPLPSQPQPSPYLPGGGARSGGIGESTPAGIGGAYRDPTIAPPVNPTTTSGGYLGAGASTATNYDYGSDTAYTNYRQIGGPYPVDQNTMMATDYVSSGDFEYYGGYATGGDFIVGGYGGTDSQLVQFHATPGERVSVDSGDGRGGGSGLSVGDINLHFGAGTQKDDILQAMPIIRAEMRRALEEAARER